MRNEMNDFALALDAAMDRHQASRKDHPALSFIEFWPDHEICDAGLVLDGDENDAFRRTRHLPHEHEASGFKPAAVAGLHSVGASDHALAAQVVTQEGDRVAAQSQPHMTIVLDHFAAGGHRPECYGWLMEFRDGSCFAG